MLLLLGGSGGAGKSAIVRHLAGNARPLLAAQRLDMHDLDELGVPSDADTVWRQKTGERWIQRALASEAEGRDLLLAGNLPLGEVLAAPSADRLDGIGVCLIDCHDPDRVARLRARDHPSYTTSRIWDFVLFAAWQRLHHADPGWMPDLITAGGWTEMRWERWAGWREGDARWSVPIVDTSGEPVEASARRVAGWIDETIHLRDAGALPLRRGAW